MGSKTHRDYPSDYNCAGWTAKYGVPLPNTIVLTVQGTVPCPLFPFGSADGIYVCNNSAPLPCTFWDLTGDIEARVTFFLGIDIFVRFKVTAPALAFKFAGNNGSTFPNQAVCGMGYTHESGTAVISWGPPPLS